MNGLILRPLNVPQAQSLYGIERASDKDTSQSYPDYLDLRDRNRSFDGLAAYSIAQVGLDTGERSVPCLGRGSERKLLRRITDSAVSWPFLPRLR